MTPARTWVLLVAFATAVTLAVLALAALLERRAPGRGALPAGGPGLPRGVLERVDHRNAERLLGFGQGEGS